MSWDSNHGCLGQADIGSGEREGGEGVPGGGGVGQVACPNIISRDQSPSEKLLNC